LKRTLSIIFVALAGIAIAGMPYFTLPMSGRVRSPYHAWLRPSGHIGQTLGILGLAFFLFLWLYPIRKHYPQLAATGSIARWLHVHVIAGLTVPFIVAIHAGFRFSGLAGLAFAAMAVVWMSGIVGRYLYARIPRSRSGLALSIQEIGGQREDLIRRIAAATGLHPADVRKDLGVEDIMRPGLSKRQTLRLQIAGDLARRRAVHEFRERIIAGKGGAVNIDVRALDEALRCARQELALAQQLRLLDGTQRVFRFWHVAHRPVAVTALVAVTVHVVVVISVGSTWFR
jgi:hypothetical protein